MINTPLPERLTATDEQALFQAFIESGDQHAKDMLIEGNLRLVVYLVTKQFNNTGYPTEDLVSIGSIGLIKAVHTFDVSKNIKFATYAASCIRNEILMHLRKVRRWSIETSADVPISNRMEDDEFCLLDTFGTDPNLVYETVETQMMKDLLKDIIGLIDFLDPREQLIIKRHFGVTAITQAELAKKLGISQSYVARIEKKVISKLSEMAQSIAFGSEVRLDAKHIR